jgi:hypothetical protein
MLFLTKGPLQWSQPRTKTSETRNASFPPLIYFSQVFVTAMRSLKKQVSAGVQSQDLQPGLSILEAMSRNSVPSSLALKITRNEATEGWLRAVWYSRWHGRWGVFCNTLSETERKWRGKKPRLSECCVVSAERKLGCEWRACQPVFWLRTAI